ncbi:MAG: biotin--[acetyl-CoA-carboxylase] ligase [Nitrospirae bacterium]|nr:biotin--[acetyl-CoA-carboxylase] ligase [Nitrospirota bacterium]
MNNKTRNEMIVGLLKEKPGFISGPDIAHALGITRAAVWKRIALLKKSGYVIETSYSKGYRLIQAPDLSIEEIRNSLSNHQIGKEIIFLDTTGSTNTVASELAMKGCTEGTVIIADEQTGGRGRRGRAWISPAGKNLYMSIILKPDISPRDATMLTLMSAVSCASAVKKLSTIPVSIKWPNDIMVSDRKLGGILTEIKTDMDRISYSIIGIGMNINLDIDDLPHDIRPIATSIKHETGVSQSRTQFAVEILREIGKWYSALLTSGKDRIIKEWLQLSSTIGRSVKVTAGDAIFTGTAEGIDDEGILLLRLQDNSIKKISAGDVTILR